VTTLTASPNPVVAGGDVTLTATVTSPAATPSGTVTFLDQGQPVGSSALNAAGVGSMTMSTSSVTTSGSIVARYNGDTQFDSSTSRAIHLQVVELSGGTNLASTGTNSSPASAIGVLALVVGTFLLVAARRPARTPKHRR
jgi:LPXTG-motif cell wall-anchored protein